jgi:hypothetical protein
MHLPEDRSARLRLAAYVLIAVVAAVLFGWATVAGAGSGAMGVVARRSDAQLKVVAQPGAKASITVTRVAAPHDSWIVVHLDAGGGKPGMRIGVAPIKAGVSENVVVPLDAATLTPQLLIAVHVDHGARGTFEFDMKRPEVSPDVPYFVDGKELATTVAVGTGASAPAAAPVGMATP